MSCTYARCQVPSHPSLQVQPQADSGFLLSLHVPARARTERPTARPRPRREGRGRPLAYDDTFMTKAGTVAMVRGLRSESAPPSPMQPFAPRLPRLFEVEEPPFSSAQHWQQHQRLGSVLGFAVTVVGGFKMKRTASSVRLGSGLEANLQLLAI